jgi:hypothetical protein
MYQEACMPVSAPFAKVCQVIVFLKRRLLRPFGFAAFTVLALPIGLLAQALVEYALQSGSSAVAQMNGSYIAGCNVNPGLFGCLSRSYPRAAIVVGILVLVIFVRLLGGVSKYRAR